MQPQFITLAIWAKNITGQRFGRLAALGPTSRDRNKHTVWLCQCDCGNTTHVTLQSLRGGTTRSCGCLYREDIGRRSKTHGKSHTPLYNTWQHMRMRCANGNDKNYGDYGGRGITVCAEWQTSYESFADHVSQLPNFRVKGYTLDRIDNDGNYVPGNVRWVLHRVQIRNRRNTRMLSYDGRTQSIAAWAEETGIKTKVIYARLEVYGYSAEEALTTPLHTRGRRHHLFP